MTVKSGLSVLGISVVIALTITTVFAISRGHTLDIHWKSASDEIRATLSRPETEKPATKETAQPQP